VKLRLNAAMTLVKSNMTVTMAPCEEQAVKG
jgi:hypothetical protein